MVDRGTKQEGGRDAALLLSWAAGLFEGEGCLNWCQRKSGKYQVQVRLAMTDRDIVERFRDVMGFGNVRERRSPAHAQQGWKPLWEWYAQDAPRVREVIQKLLPWLGERRRARALEVLAIAEQIEVPHKRKTHCPQGHPLEGENLILEPIHGGKYKARRCRTCRVMQSRARARKRLGITPDRYRVKGV